MLIILVVRHENPMFLGRVQHVRKNAHSPIPVAIHDCSSLFFMQCKTIRKMNKNEYLNVSNVMNKIIEKAMHFWMLMNKYN